MQRPVLILCVDRDNDLYEKGKVSGPLIGRQKNVDGAIKLALADPEDPDSNTIFYAVKIYDAMKQEGREVEIVTVTGHKSLGYAADKEVSDQLDKVLRETHATSCVLVSDGAADEELLPVIKSRIKIDSTKIVFIKQAKELEKTYFVLLEKLRDPYYAKIIIGVPAILILLLSLSSYFGMSWQPVGIIVGVYLILRGFGLDERISAAVRDFRFSTERIGWIGYVGGMVLFLVSLTIGYQASLQAASLGLKMEKSIALIINNTIFVLLLSFIFIIAGKYADSIMEKRKFMLTKYALYAVAAVIVTLVLSLGSRWVLNFSEPYISFGEFILAIIIAMLAGYVSTIIIRDIRTDMLLGMKLDGREVVNEHGAYVGKVVGVSGGENALIVQTFFEKKFSLPFALVSAVTENNVIVKTIA
jgi:putative membrane protein